MKVIVFLRLQVVIEQGGGSQRDSPQGALALAQKSSKVFVGEGVGEEGR